MLKRYYRQPNLANRWEQTTFTILKIRRSKNLHFTLLEPFRNLSHMQNKFRNNMQFSDCLWRTRYPAELPADGPQRGGVREQITISKPQQHLGIIYEGSDSIPSVLRLERRPQRIRDHGAALANDYEMILHLYSFRCPQRHQRIPNKREMN